MRAVYDGYHGQTRTSTLPSGGNAGDIVEANNYGVKFKTENVGNDAITDNVAGQAYVEQFAMEVFNRAEAAMRADKVTKYVEAVDSFDSVITG